MKKLMEKVSEMLRHNPAVSIAILLGVLLLVWSQGCSSTVESLINPERKVTRTELQLEVKQQTQKLQQSTETRVAELNRQIANLVVEGSLSLETLAVQAQEAEKRLNQIDGLKQKAAEIGLVVAEGGTVNPVGLLTTLMGILGVGAVVDNRKKDGLLTPNPAKKKS